MTWYAMPMPGISVACHFMPKHRRPIPNTTYQLNCSAAYYPDVLANNSYFQTVSDGPSSSFKNTHIGCVGGFDHLLNPHADDSHRCHNHEGGTRRNGAAYPKS